ncbi:MAG: polyketide cyclase, partial [Candidatus Sumerlaeota bacterium]
MIALAVIVGVIIVAGIILVAVASKRPAEFAISRNITIAAPPKLVFDQVNDFHKWAAWSPWEHIDPNMQRDYSGSPSGVGAVYAYDGNKK